MNLSRDQRIKNNIKNISDNFPEFLKVYDNDPPFKRYGQFEYHQTTMSFRKKAASAISAISDYSFLNYLYKTLNAWGIGLRGSHLLSFPDFKKELLSKSEQIADLDGLRIDDPGINLQKVIFDLWQLIDSLAIVDNKAKLVSCSKTLHHVLPDLVVPIDRAYTRKFFEWHGPEFQYNQRDFFFLAMKSFATIARATNPNQYVGERWNTSQTKVIDNAIVGYLMKYPRMDL